jgi:F-type H+-transporting ATPase subunit b
MPQFDPNFFTPQLFWLAVTFIGLYLVLATVAVPRIGQVLDDRQRRIDSDLERAGALKTEAEAAIAAYEKALAESRAHAQKVVRETTERMAKESEARHKDLADRLQAQINAGEQRILAAKQEALSHVREVAGDVAGAIHARLLGTQPDAQRTAQAVAAAMEQG